MHAARPVPADRGRARDVRPPDLNAAVRYANELVGHDTAIGQSTRGQAPVDGAPVSCFDPVHEFRTLYGSRTSTKWRRQPIEPRAGRVESVQQDAAPDALPAPPFVHEGRSEDILQRHAGAVEHE